MRLVSGMFGNEKYFEANFERLSGGPGPIGTYPAEPREGGKGGGKPPPWGLEVRKDKTRKRKTEERRTGSTRRPVGRRILAENVDRASIWDATFLNI